MANEKPAGGNQASAHALREKDEEIARLKEEVKAHRALCWLEQCRLGQQMQAESLLAASRPQREDEP